MAYRKRKEKKKISKKYGLYDSSAEQNMQKYFRKRGVCEHKGKNKMERIAYGCFNYYC